MPALFRSLTKRASTFPDLAYSVMGFEGDNQPPHFHRWSLFVQRGEIFSSLTFVSSTGSSEVPGWGSES